jgi:KaiC/GvpD/RAD55 family RecA-like ATPase
MQLNSAETAFTKCSEVDIPDAFYNRMSTGCSEIDLMFGSQYFPGLMPGSAITITGTPGAGKSTMLLQTLQRLAVLGNKVAIASGEESHVQLAYTCKRLKVTDVEIAHIKDVEIIAEAMKDYKVMVVDSFQALRSNDPKLGKKAFLQYAQDLLLAAAKDTGCVLIFVLHITTAGLPKGGTDIIHAVDVNVKLTVDSNDQTLRVIDVYKNRFGETKKHSAIMGIAGFEFNGEYDPLAMAEDFEDEVSPVTTGPLPPPLPGSVRSISDIRKNIILSLTEPPHITLNRVMKILGVKNQTAGILLRELLREGKVKKYGRGENACWKLVRIGHEVYQSLKK